MSAECCHTAQDVAEALARLSQVSQSISPCSPQDLQQWWQVVAAAAGSGDAELGAALEHLKAIYKVVEDVIIGCGAPDTFEIYEVCFETLTKAGSFLRSASAKEQLLKVLEEVHEVFDVLLSCVETYEWVQPGSSGLLRFWMLQVVFMCFGSATITGRDLMELTDNDVSGAVSLISFLLRCDKAPFEMQATAGRCLVELTTADSIFLAKTQDGTAEELQNQEIAKLTGMLNRHVNGLIKGIIQFDIVEAFGRCICQHQMSHQRTDIIVKFFLNTIHNCLLYCSENQKKLRQHLATQSTIVQDIMIPYVNNILPALYDNPASGPGLLEWQNLKATLQTFAVVTFNINVFRSHFQQSTMILDICKVPRILSYIIMLELLIKIAINVDFVKSTSGDAIATTLQVAYEQLSPESKERLYRRMTSEQSMRLPYSKSSTQAIQRLVFAFTGQGEDPPSLAAAPASGGRKRWGKRGRKAKNKARKKKLLFAMHSHKANTPEAPEDDPKEEEEEGDDDSDDDMPPLIPASGWEGELGQADEAGVPSKAVCELTGALMHDPVCTPDGHTFDRAALEDWTRTHATNPFSGAPLSMEECQPAPELQGYIQGYQMQMLSACEIAPEAFEEAFEEPPQPEIEVPQPKPAAPLVRGPSLLGDLPQLAASQKKKKEKSKIRIESRSVVECPDEMRCSIDGKVMTNPVRSPLGHYFEKKTLERWVTSCGSVCPITSKPLRLDECTPDAEMKKRIIKFLKNQQ